jgi:hypothetical protein
VEHRVRHALSECRRAFTNGWLLDDDGVVGVAHHSNWEGVLLQDGRLRVSGGVHTRPALGLRVLARIRRLRSRAEFVS